MRTQTRWSNATKEEILQDLLRSTEDPKAYRNAMYRLGTELGKDIAEVYSDPNSDVYVACTVEDADFLARGILQAIEQRGAFLREHLACFWNQRETIDEGIEIAPIIRRYQEPSDAADPVLIIVKSIISGACVVKTNLTPLIDELRPTKVIVTAPVMREGAEDRLAKEFPNHVAARFEYVTYAIDSERSSDGNIVPGIGGTVYDLLGLGGKEMKNQYVPDIVKERRETLIGRSRRLQEPHRYTF